MGELLSKSTQSHALNENQQVELVERLLLLAKELDLPVAVHCQGPGTYEVMLAALKRHLRRSHHLQLHSFAGSSAIVQSFLTDFPNTSLGDLLFHRPDLDKMVQSLDLARILLETDAPYLAPTSTSFHRNHMGNVFRVGERMAGEKRSSTSGVRSGPQECDAIFWNVIWDRLGAGS